MKNRFRTILPAIFVLAASICCAIEAVHSPLPSPDGIEKISFQIAVVMPQEKRLAKLMGQSTSPQVYGELKRLIEEHKLKLAPKEAQGGQPGAADSVFLTCKTQGGRTLTVGVYNRKLAIIDGVSYDIIRSSSTNSISPQFYQYLLSHPGLWTEVTDNK